MFQLIVCPLMLQTNYRCVQSLNISVDVTKCVENVHKFTQYTHFCPLQKTTCPDWTIYSWQDFNSIGCPLILTTYNYRCFQQLNISVDVAKCVENVHKFTQYTHFLSVTKTTCLDWTIYSWQGFNSIRMSSYAKNKQQMCSVTQHQCRRRQMCGKCSQIHPVHSLFVRYKKRHVLIEQSIHGKVSTQ